MSNSFTRCTLPGASAGSYSAEAHHDLGFQVPAAILENTTRLSSLTGLGIYIDPSYFEDWEGMTPSPSPDQSYPSPPLAHISVLAEGDAIVGLGINMAVLGAKVLTLSS